MSIELYIKQTLQIFGSLCGPGELNDLPLSGDPGAIHRKVAVLMLLLASTFLTKSLLHG